MEGLQLLPKEDPFQYSQKTISICEFPDFQGGMVSGPPVPTLDS